MSQNFMQRPWYPLLFAAYPVLGLLAVNVGQTRDSVRWGSLCSVRTR
jgi:hypothetical protein